MEPARPILIRHSGVGDQAALERLAALDSRTLRAGSFLLAEVDGELVAAAPLDIDEEPLSDPTRSGPRPTFASYSGCRQLTFGGIATPSIAPPKQRQSAFFEKQRERREGACGGP